MAGLNKAYKRRPSMVAMNGGPVLCLDAGSKLSYPGSGTTWTDISGNANNGTLVNGPTFDSANGGSLVFNGTNQYAALPSSPLWALGSNATIEMWTYVTGSRTNNHRFWCVNNTLNALDAYIDNATGRFGTHGLGFFTSNIYPYNAWNHLVVVYSSGVPSVYFNNVSQSLTGIVSGYNITTTGTLFIGQYSGGGSYYINGKIPVFKIYNRALSATEVATNFSLLRGRYGI